MKQFKNLMNKNKKIKDQLKQKKLRKHVFKKKKKRLAIKFTQVFRRLRKEKKLLIFYKALKTKVTSVLLNDLNSESIEKKITIKKLALNNLLQNKLLITKDRIQRHRQKWFRGIKNLRQYKLWKKKDLWILKQKTRKYLQSIKRIRLKQNINVEVNTKIYAFTFITKEFLHSPKFIRSKPVAFTNRINRFIKHFF